MSEGGREGGREREREKLKKIFDDEKTVLVYA